MKKKKKTMFKNVPLLRNSSGTRYRLIIFCDQRNATYHVT